MYKYLIVIIALMFAGAGGYYIDKAGGGIMGDIIMGNITTQDTLVPVNIEDLPGTYICNTASTCKNKYTLLLKGDKTAELTQSPEETGNSSSEEVSQDTDSSNTEQVNRTEKGNWELGVQNMLIITLTNQGEKIYDVPQKIVVKNVKNTTLSKISYTKANYKDIMNLIFIKQE